MHYADEAFPGPSLTPADPVARAQMRMFEKLMDEYVHVSCMTLTFATANRVHLMKLSPQEMDEELAKAPDQKRSEIKRQVVTHGLDAPLVMDALRHHDKLLRHDGDGAGLGSVSRRRGLVARRRRGDALHLAARQAQARAAVESKARHRRLVRSHSRAAVIQAGGRRLGQRRRSRSLRQPARSLAEGVGASRRRRRRVARRRQAPLRSFISPTKRWNR